MKQTLLHNIQGLIYYIGNPSPSAICRALDDIDVHHYACWYTAVRRVFLNCISCLMDIEPSSMLINTECTEFSIYLLVCIHVSPAMVEVTMIVHRGDMVKAFWNEFLRNWVCSIGKLTETYVKKFKS